jgi:hypothetical protein
MKPTKGRKTTGRKTTAAKDGRASRGLVKKALGFVGKHPKAAAATAGVVAAGVGAYALLRGGKSKKKASSRAKTKTRLGT